MASSTWSVPTGRDEVGRNVLDGDKGDSDHVRIAEPGTLRRFEVGVAHLAARIDRIQAEY